MSNSGYFPNVVNPGINKIQTMTIVDKYEPKIEIFRISVLFF